MSPNEQDYVKCTTRHTQGKKFDFQKLYSFPAAGTNKWCGFSITAEQSCPRQSEDALFIMLQALISYRQTALKMEGKKMLCRQTRDESNIFKCKANLFKPCTLKLY